MQRTSLFTIAFGLCAACHTTSPSSPHDAPVIVDAAIDAALIDGPTERIRILTGNLSSGNLQTWDPGEGIRLVQAMQPDVAMLQEVNYGANQDADVRAFVDAAFDPSFNYFREVGAQLPNAVVTRYPILDSGSWVDAQVANRTFVWARIDVPGPRDLWAISVHLLTTGSSERDAEATALVALMQANIPAGDLVTLGGDFNTQGRAEACMITLSQYFTTTAPYPADQIGNDNTNSTRAHPEDWVLGDADLAPLEVPLVVGTSTFYHGLVFDTRVYTPLTDVPAALPGDSAAANMQHMAVVRAFALPL